MPKLLIAHGGAPTAVINASLYGAIIEAKRLGVGVLGALHGTEGILRERFYDLGALDATELERLRFAPASVIGTSRTPLEAPDYAKMADIFAKHDIAFALLTGGNGTMDACGKLNAACAGKGIRVGGIPKTIDNDIAVIDHAPGYGSAARFAAQSMLAIAQDVASLPIHVCIVEYMGRNTGWITAASALARQTRDDAPHIILLPEAPFDEARFLERVSEVWRRGTGVIVAVSEGICLPNGAPVAPPVFTSGRSVYYGDASAYLAKRVIQKLGIKARGEKPGILGRCLTALASETDREEAVRLGALAARTVISGKGGMMAGLKRLSDSPYRCEETLIPVERVMLTERPLPAEYYDSNNMDVTGAFLSWVAPLTGEPLPKPISLR